MTDTTKVYLVSSGNYSDYSIRAAFSTREKAEAFVAACHAKADRQAHGAEWRLAYGEEHSVEEYEIDATEPDVDGCYRVHISVGRADTFGSSGDYAVWDEASSATTPASAERSTYRLGQIDVTGYGETPEHARRSAAELARAITAGTVIVP